VPYEPYGYPAYVVVRAQPRGGAQVVGMRVNEDTFTIQLRDQQGRVHSFRKSELQQLRTDPATSLMPDYRDTLKKDEIEDLVAYLMTRQTKR
jgi:cytochrome c oxidase cbb3-type subunit III